MTMLDDDRLASLFAHAGDAFEVPASGVEDILARAAGPARDAEAGGPARRPPPGPVGEPAGPVRDGRARRLVALAGRHRVLSAAACIVVALVVAGTVGALVRAPSGPTMTSGLPRTTHAAPSAPAGGVTTTVPTGSRPRSAPTRLRRPRPRRAPRRATSAPSAAAGRRSPRRPRPRCRAAPSASPAKIEQTGTLGPRRRPRRPDEDHDEADRAGRRQRRLRGELADPVRRRNGGAPYGTITLQVPVANFSAVLKQAQALGRTTDLTTKATDVTGQYVDLQARIAALAGQPPAVPDHPGQGDVGGRRAVRAGAARHHPVADRAAAGPTAGPDERDVVLDADRDRQRGRAGTAPERRCPSRGSCGRGTTASAASSPAWRAWSAWPARSSSRCSASPSSLVGGPGAVAPLPAAPAVAAAPLRRRWRRPAGCPASSPRRCRRRARRPR